MRLNSLLLLLLFTGSSHAAFWNKNKRDEAPRRRLTEVPTNTVDVDAATGTVLNVAPTADQDAAKAAQTCDGQMAQSLVKANEEMMKAQVERDSLKREKDAALQQIRELQRTLAEAQEAKNDLTFTLQQTEKAKDEKIQSLTDSLKMSQEDLVNEYEGQLRKSAENHAAEVNSLNVKIEALKDQNVALMNSIESKSDEASMQAEHAMKAALAKAQQEHAGELEAMKRRLEAQAEEAKSHLQSQLQAKDKKINEAKVESKLAKDAMKEQQHELELWRNTFASRSYCNMTYIAEDMAWAGQQALDKTTEVAIFTYEALVDFSRVVVKEVNAKSTIAWKATKKYSRKAKIESKRFYSQKLKPQYEKHLKPKVDEHVVPLVDKVSKTIEREVTPKFSKAKDSIQPKIDQLKKAYDKQFKIVAKKYASVCKKTFKSAADIAKSREITFFDEKLAPQWDHSCKNPEESLKAAQIGILLILMLPFILSIVRLALGVVAFLLSIFIAITPLRFVIGRSKKSKKGVQSSKGDARLKKKVGLAESQ